MKPSILESRMVKPQHVEDGTEASVPRIHVDSSTSVSTAQGGIKRKISPDESLTHQELNHSRWKRPKWTRGFIWSKNEHSRTPSATATETAPPYASIPKEELQNLVAIETINSRPDLFKIISPIDVDHFQELLRDHPNCALVDPLVSHSEKDFGLLLISTPLIQPCLTLQTVR